MGKLLILLWVGTASTLKSRQISFLYLLIIPSGCMFFCGENRILLPPQQGANPNSKIPVRSLAPGFVVSCGRGNPKRMGSVMGSNGELVDELWVKLVNSPCSILFLQRDPENSPDLSETLSSFQSPIWQGL